MHGAKVNSLIIQRKVPDKELEEALQMHKRANTLFLHPKDEKQENKA